MASAPKPERIGSNRVCAQRRLCGTDPARAVAATTTTNKPSPKPLPLSPALRARQALQLTQRLSGLIDGQVSVVVTDNRAVMISVRREHQRRRYAVRLHHIFVDAPRSTLRDLARYIELNDPAASRRLGRFIDAHDARIDASSRPPLPPRRQTMRQRGRVYDLQQILETLEQRYFGKSVGAQITWGYNRARGNARRSIRLGSCCLETRVIRIHPGLDQEWVPRFYLEWVVYHEMLHCVHPVKVLNGRRVFHSARFAADERLFENHQLAHSWERRNLAALLCL